MVEIKYTCHGAGRSIGASCIELELGGVRLLLDYGIEISRPVNILPTEIENVKKIDLVFGTHPHEDHMGGLPMLYQNGYDGAIISPDICSDTSNILHWDSYKIERQNLRGQEPYNPDFIGYARNRMRESWQGSIGEVNYRLIPAGHIPGSVCVYIEYKGKSILYTGDVNGAETRLMEKCGRLPKADILVLDATYGNAKHPSRTASEKRLAKIIGKTIKRGGSVLIGTFAVAKGQELQILIDQINPTVPCYLDGMARSITDIYLKAEHKRFFKQQDLEMANYRWKHVRDWHERKRIIKRQAIILASSATLNAGAVMDYLPDFLPNKKNSVVSVGHQFEGSNSRLLCEDGKVIINNLAVNAECDACNVTYSSHSDAPMLKKMIDQVDPKLVIAQHGNDQAVDAILDFAQKQGREIWGPKIGESQMI